MLALARFTLKGPYQAAAVVGMLAVLAVFIPPMAQNSLFAVLLASICMLLSCILVGLIILTQGSVSGLKAIAAAILGITIVAWILVNAPVLGLLTGLVQWLPIIVLAQTLRSSKSLALTMLVGLGLGVIGIAAQYLVWSDLEKEWITLALQRMEQAGQLDERIVAANLAMIRWAHAGFVASAYFLLIIIVLTARWMQARLAQSKGFREEFHRLALGKPAAAAALVLILSSFFVKQSWLNSLGFLLMLAFMFQGIAVVHSKLATRRQAGMLLGLFYLALIVGNRITVPLTALTGIVDNWVIFRKKPENPNDENEL